MSYENQPMTVKQIIGSILGWIVILGFAWFGWTHWLSPFIHDDSKPKSYDSNEHHDDLLRRSQSNDHTNWVPGSVGR
jgi:hypothetical protein